MARLTAALSRIATGAPPASSSKPSDIGIERFAFALAPPLPKTGIHF
ncbi:MAG: hypothetical protein J0H34_23740 [Rhizobiales bacterium]|nr:hypothetical protein [Hyphomicrobiales bacterium]